MIVHLLVNPDAGRGTAGAATNEVREALEGAGATVRDVPASSPQAAEQAVRDAIAGGADRIVVAGGDGAVHIAVQALAGTDAVLGVVPMGTGNDFAGALELPTNLEESARAALGQESTLDLLEVDGRWAASIATLGFSAAVNERANRMRWPKGPARYSLATVAELRRLASVPLDISLDGRRQTLDTTLATFANTAYFGGGMQISPDADPNDGVADITHVGSVGRVQLLRFFRRVFDGSHMAHPAVRGFRASTIEIHTPGLAIWADGEPVTTTPSRLRVVAGALRVAGIVPA